jgi:hypothetical protein
MYTLPLNTMADNKNTKKECKTDSFMFASSGIFSAVLLTLVILGWVAWARIPHAYKPRHGNLGKGSALAFAISGMFLPGLSIGSLVISAQSMAKLKV